MSRVGLWESWYSNAKERAVYGDPRTAKRAGAFLNVSGIVTAEDWGCGLGGFRQYLGDHQTYIGVDGSRSPFVDVVCDLEHYRSSVDAIHLRHVLEHNHQWAMILENAVGSFQKRMVLTLFTPWAEETAVMASYPDFLQTGQTMVDISFKRSDIVDRFSGVAHWTSEENMATGCQYGVEHMFFLEKR